MSRMRGESNITPEEEFQSYLAKIDSGEGEFLFKAGFCYIKGYGTEQDVAKGEALLRKAADNGDAATQYFLSSMYNDGQILEKNEELALKYCKLAAEGGIMPAKYNLGNYFYEQGKYEQAEEQFIIAASNGVADAQCNLGILYFNIDTLKETEPRLLDLARAKFWLVSAKQEECSEPALIDRALADAKLRLRRLLKKSGESTYDCNAVKATLDAFFEEDTSDVIPDNGEKMARLACILISEDYIDAFGQMADLIEAGFYPAGTEHDVEMLRLTEYLLSDEESDE